MNYKDAVSFRRAIEQRLLVGTGGSSSQLINRRRKMIIFDRFLARLLAIAPGVWVAKGGVALSLRFPARARTTVDLDLALESDENEVLDYFEKAAALNLDDFFVFGFERTAIAANTMRFRVHASLGGRPFETILVDVNASETLPDRPDQIPGNEFFAFAGIPPITVPLVPLERHLAEKLHAYSRTYGAGHASSRVKDLIDMVLIVETGQVDRETLIREIEITFTRRATHAVPGKLHPPSSDWRIPYRAMALDVGIDPSIETGYRFVQDYFDDILPGEQSEDR